MVHAGMHVFAEVNSQLDVPFWVKRDDFLFHFDQADFLNREVAQVQSAYLKAWFYEDEGPTIRFYIPVVGAVGRRTDLIGTRHRVAVLLPHLEELPFAFASLTMSTEARHCLDSIPKRPLDVRQSFWIPDLPVHDSLPCPPN